MPRQYCRLYAFAVDVGCLDTSINMKHYLGFKKGMTQVYADGDAIPVTIVQIPDNYVAGLSDSSGRILARIGVGQKKRPTKALEGTYRDLKFVPDRTWDVVIEGEKSLKIGDKHDASGFGAGDRLQITGITKGKGFAGVVKRWGFAGGQRTRGQTDRLRAPGSIGAGTDPGRVFKGTKMGGRMGGRPLTLLKRTVVDVGDDYILVRGALPGNSGDVLKIQIVEKNTKADES